MSDPYAVDNMWDIAVTWNVTIISNIIEGHFDGTIEMWDAPKFA